MSTQSELPLEDDPGTPGEFGFNPLAIIATVKRISAELAAIRAFLVKIAPVLDAVKAAMGQQQAQAPGEFSAAAEKLESMP